MVPEILSPTDWIFSHFGPFVPPFYHPNNPKNQNFEKLKKTPRDIIILHMCTIHDNHMMYGSWDMECDRQNFLLFKNIFCPKNQNFEKMKKTPGHIITTLLKCTINDNHMMYCSWDIKHDGQNSLSFWTIFCPFTPLTTWKVKILKNWKKRLEIFYTGVT